MLTIDVRNGTSLLCCSSRRSEGTQQPLGPRCFFVHRGSGNGGDLECKTIPNQTTTCCGARRPSESRSTEIRDKQPTFYRPAKYPVAKSAGCGPALATKF